MTSKYAETTDLVFILDRSGSMYGLESDTIGGFNSVIEQQRTLPGTAHVTTVLFDDIVELLHKRTPLDKVAPLTTKTYNVRGCTALLDALGSTIKHINKQQKLDGKRPDHTIVVVITDGMENASREYTLDKVRTMVEKRQKKNGWEFIFLGANMDAIQAASSIGIRADHAATYIADQQGTRVLYDAVGCAVASARSDGNPVDQLERVRMDTAKRQA